MTGPSILDADIELFLTGYIRAAIRQPDLLAKYPVLANFEVSNREPAVDDDDFPAKLIVVRNDGNTSTSLTTGNCSVGVTVLMGSVEHVGDASLAARIVHAIVKNCAQVEAGNPVAAVTASTGPYAVAESQPRARLYATHDLATVGASL